MLTLSQRAQEARERNSKPLEEVDFGYDYPNGLNWRPGIPGELHEFVLNELLDKVRASREHTKPMRQECKHVDWALTAYVPPDQAEKKALASDWRKPVAIVVPASFASLETFLAYMQAAYGRSPLHSYRGGPGKRGVIGGALYERVIAKQNQWFKELLHLNTMFRSAFSHGIGMASITWRKHKAQKYVDQKVTELLGEALKELNLGAKVGDVLRYMEHDVIFEGNRLDPIDEYNAILDPTVTLNNIQESEFIGWMRRTNAMEILRKEDDPEENTFNGKYAYMLAEQGLGKSTFWGRDDDERNGRSGSGTSTEAEAARRIRHPLDEITILVDLIPYEWGLSEKKTPERWMFRIVADRVIISATVLDLDHGMWPIAACGPNTTGFDITPVSHLVTTFGLQKAVDWVWRSRMYNLMKTIHGITIVDPTKFEMDDVLDPQPGNIWRLKQAAYGAGGIDAFAKQFDVRDVTAGHVKDVQYMIDLIRQGHGTTDLTMGLMGDMPDRPTGQGIGMMTQAAMSRLAFVARTIGLQAIDDIAWQEAYNTRQFMSKEVQISILGEYEADLRSEYGIPPGVDEMSVNPLDLSPNFEIEPHNPVMPGGNQIQGVQAVMQTLLAVPGVAETIAADTSVPGVFKKWARLNGFDDIYEFSKAGGSANVAVMPDANVQRQVQAGNLVPASSIDGGMVA